MNNSLSHKKINYIFYTLFSLGVFLRLHLYFLDRSIWLDEAYLTFNIIEKSLTDLILYPLDYNQIAPLGFMIFEKFISTILGYSTLTLRLFPLICSFLSLYFFYKLANSFLKPILALLSLLLFSIIPEVIYYSSEIKQYSSDILCTILSLLLIIKFLNTKSNKESTQCLLSIPLLIIVSLQSIIFIGSNSLILFIIYLKERTRSNFIKLLSWTFTWIIFYTIYYFSQVKVHINNQYLIDYWNHGYISLDISRDFFIAENLLKYLNLPGLEFTGLFILIGIANLFKIKKYSLVLLIPTFSLLAISFLHLYPLADRLILFFIPIISLFFGSCFEFLLNTKNKLLLIWSSLLICLFFISPLNALLTSFYKNQDKENMKPVLKYIKENCEPEDIIYINHFSQYTFKYHAKEFGFNDDFTLPKNWSHPTYFKNNFLTLQRWYKKKNYNTIFIAKSSAHTTKDRRNIDFEVNQLYGKRTWIILRNDKNHFTHKSLISLKKQGKELWNKKYEGKNGYGQILYLFDFSKNK